VTGAAVGVSQPRPTAAHVAQLIGTDSPALSVLHSQPGLGTVLLADPAGYRDPAEAATQAAVAAVPRLAELARTQHAGAVSLLAWAADPGGLAAATVVETLRGIAQSVTREVDPARMRVNVVVADPSRPADVTATLAFLASAEGSYTAGATLDLAAAATAGSPAEARPRLAVVTGAAGGIGRAVVARLAGTREVLAVDVGPPTSELPAGVSWLASDLLDPSGADAVADAARRRGGADLLVAAHGLGGTGALTTLDEPRVRRVMEVNTATCARLLTALAVQLNDVGGAAVLVASQAGLTGEAEHVAYCASKFALVGWARAAARHPGLSDIRLRLICPGCVDTAMFRSAITNWARSQHRDPAAVLADRVAQIPAGRLAQPSEIAAGTAYLAAVSAPGLVVLNQSGGETFPA